MQIQAWDEVFIRCRRTTVNTLIIDLASWPRWWPGLASSHTTVGRGGEVSSVDLVLTDPRPWGVAQRLRLRPDRVRPRDKGLEFSVSGDVVGTGEWFHLDHPHGVIVHYLLNGQLKRGNPRRWLAAHRASVRAALTDLKRRLERGRVPGAEPHPELVAHQAEEMSIYAAEVAAHEAEQASSQPTTAPTAFPASTVAPVPAAPLSSVKA